MATDGLTWVREQTYASSSEIPISKSCGCQHANAPKRIEDEKVLVTADNRRGLSGERGRQYDVVIRIATRRRRLNELVQALDAYKDLLPRVTGDPVLEDFIRKQIELETGHVQEIVNAIKAGSPLK